MWLFLMCGPAFSGKTTLSRQVSNQLGFTLVSYDALLASLGFNQEAMTDQNWRELHKRARLTAGEILSSGRSVIVDDTFPKRFLRDRFRQVAGEHRAGFLILELVTTETTLRQRTQMNLQTGIRRHVPWQRIEDDLKAFERPDTDERVLA